MFLRWIYLVALALWLGELVFFSFIVAPSVFKVLAVADAGRVVAAIFPRYYALGVACGAVCVVAAADSWRRYGGTPWVATTVLLAVMLAATLYAATVVHPRAAALRQRLRAAAGEAAEVAAQTEFDRLHRLSVQINGAVLLLALAATGTTAAGLRP